MVALCGFLPAKATLALTRGIPAASARVRTVLRGLIADAAKGDASDDGDEDGEAWEEVEGDDAAEALAALEVGDKKAAAPAAAAPAAASKSKAKGKK